MTHLCAITGTTIQPGDAVRLLIVRGRKRSPRVDVQNEFGEDLDPDMSLSSNGLESEWEAQGPSIKAACLSSAVYDLSDRSAERVFALCAANLHLASALTRDYDPDTDSHTVSTVFDSATFKQTLKQSQRDAWRMLNDAFDQSAVYNIVKFPIGLMAAHESAWSEMARIGLSNEPAIDVTAALDTVRRVVDGIKPTHIGVGDVTFYEHQACREEARHKLYVEPALRPFTRLDPYSFTVAMDEWLRGDESFMADLFQSRVDDIPALDAMRSLGIFTRPSIRIDDDLAVYRDITLERIRAETMETAEHWRAARAGGDAPTP